MWFIDLIFGSIIALSWLFGGGDGGSSAGSGEGGVCTDSFGNDIQC